MGRIAHRSPPLIDIETAQAVLGKSRRTIYNLIKDGRLTPRRREGSKKTWFEAREVTGLTQVHRARRGPKIRSEHLERHFRRFHPYLFTDSTP